MHVLTRSRFGLEGMVVLSCAAGAHPVVAELSKLSSKLDQDFVKRCPNLAECVLILMVR